MYLIDSFCQVSGPKNSGLGLPTKIPSIEKPTISRTVCKTANHVRKIISFKTIERVDSKMRQKMIDRPFQRWS